MFKQKMMRFIALWIRRAPFLAVLIQRIARLVHGRFTIGAVGVLLDSEDRVLIVEHVFHPKTPWGLPGGWVDRNELPQQAVEREFREETGLVVTTLYPLAVWANHVLRRHVDMAFAVGLEPGQESPVIQLSGELLAYCWVSRDALPPLLPEHVYVIDLALARRQEYRARNETPLASEKEKKGKVDHVCET